MSPTYFRTDCHLFLGTSWYLLCLSRRFQPDGRSSFISIIIKFLLFECLGSFHLVNCTISTFGIILVLEVIYNHAASIIFHISQPCFISWHLLEIKRFLNCPQNLLPSLLLLLLELLFPIGVPKARLMKVG